MAAELVLELDRAAPAADNPGAAFAREIRRQLGTKGAFDGDTPDIRRLKGILRRGEARASLQTCGVDASRMRFLDLPFYENGRYRQFELSENDEAVIIALLREVRPHQIFATGQSADPSTVPAICFEVLRRALARTQAEPWSADCRVWLYRSPDREWEPAEIEMAVPLSPRELTQKVQAIYHHKSQRSQSPMVAAGLHEAWQQAEHHNRAIARAYDALGLAEYEAIEAFQRWSPA